MTEIIPLSENCPLRWVDLDDDTKIKLRDRAAEIFYRDLVEPDEVSKQLVDEFGVTREDADEADFCLHRIMRNYCMTCKIGQTAAGIGIVARK